MCSAIGRSLRTCRSGSHSSADRGAADPPTELDPWAAQRLDELCALADRGRLALAGDCLAHTDLRADNVLLGPDGSVTPVDWPDGCRAAPWLDSVLLLINVRLFGGIDVQARLAGFAVDFGVDPVDLVYVLVSPIRLCRRAGPPES